jgi:uncharacterized membrane protein YhaH (DUF805 family)
MLRQVKYWFVVITLALVAGIAAAIAGVFLVARLGAYLLRSPLDATCVFNWLFWVVGISTGIGILVSVFCLWARRWRNTLRPDRPLRAIAFQTASIGAMIGFAIGVLWFELGQVGLSLAILCIHGPLGR